MREYKGSEPICYDIMIPRKKYPNDILLETCILNSIAVGMVILAALRAI